MLPGLDSVMLQALPALTSAFLLVAWMPTRCLLPPTWALKGSAETSVCRWVGVGEGGPAVKVENRVPRLTSYSRAAQWCSKGHQATRKSNLVLLFNFSAEGQSPGLGPHREPSKCSWALRTARFSRHDWSQPFWDSSPSRGLCTPPLRRL